MVVDGGSGYYLGKGDGEAALPRCAQQICSACAQGISVDKHYCFLNWTASSSEMDTDIILEGFLEAERVHGAR